MHIKDYVFLPLLFGTAISMMIMFLQGLKVTQEMFSLYPEYEAPKVSDFKWGILTAIIIHVCKRVSIPLFYPLYYRLLHDKFTGDWRAERAKKGALNLFKMMYYMIAFAAGYYFLTPLEACPPMLMGKGDLAFILKDFPMWKKPKFFDIYYAASIGYHLEGLFMHW